MQVMSRKLPIDAVLFDLASTLHGKRIGGQLAELFPDVEIALDGLRRMGLKLGMVTDKAMDAVEPVLQRFGLSMWFDIVVDGGAVAQRKPHPAPLLHACEALAVQPAHALYVGDSENDALAAQAAGMQLVRVNYVGGSARSGGGDQAESPCLQVIDSLGELLELIGSPQQPKRTRRVVQAGYRHDDWAGLYI
ncbi:HAD-IA family hydrolase [Paraburkholderia tagetis]|uniref:phosphoglycolate phosphatase n=1 Tax=Paraburkholderia tagetis TaxID=2913261 RepID=A0A9X1UH19_9BURK|nr:HAD-IA family hydrolase [Paraburkholderia tagetis]MCG5076090.1 HAD-IA family hydrolase [Paraburkholderia tagetis]